MGDGGGRAGTKALLKLPCLVGFRDFLDGDAALLEGGSFVSQERQDAIASDAGQDRAAQGRGQDRAVDDEEDVHRPAFLDVAVLLAVEPEDVVVALLLRLLDPQEAGGVVPRRLGLAGAALDGAHIFLGDPEVHRLQVVGADGTGQDDELEVFRRLGPDVLVGGEQDRTDVESASFFPGYPVSIQPDELLE